MGKPEPIKDDRVEFRSTPDGVEVWLDLKGKAKKQIPRFYIIGFAAFQDAKQIEYFEDYLDSYHMPSQQIPGFLTHIGSHTRYGKGNLMHIGNEHDSQQKQELKEFCERILAVQGGFGSWWKETFSLMKKEFSGAGALKDIEIVLMQDQPQRIIFEWDEDEISSWVEDRKKAGWETIFSIVCTKTPSGSFSDLPFISTPIPFDEYFKLENLDFAKTPDTELSISISVAHIERSKLPAPKFAREGDNWGCYHKKGGTLLKGHKIDHDFQGKVATFEGIDEERLVLYKIEN
jgi:hypothetical protein